MRIKACQVCQGCLGQNCNLCSNCLNKSWRHKCARRACLNPIMPGSPQTPKGANSVTKTTAANSKEESTKTLRSGKVCKNPINPAKVPKGANNVMKKPTLAVGMKLVSNAKYTKVSRRAVPHNTHENNLSKAMSGQAASPEAFEEGRNASTAVKQGMKGASTTPQPRASKKNPKTPMTRTLNPSKGINMNTTKDLTQKAITPSKKQAQKSRMPVEPKAQMVETPPKRELTSSTPSTSKTQKKSAGNKKPAKTPAKEKDMSIATTDQGPKKFVLIEVTEFQQQVLSSLGFREVHDVE